MDCMDFYLYNDLKLKVMLFLLFTKLTEHIRIVYHFNSYNTNRACSDLAWIILAQFFLLQ